MKKFFIRIAASTPREVNANEYNVTPKTNGFGSIVDGAPGEAWSTSGKGKSATPNFYLYFKQDGVLYYFRSTADEIDQARKAGFEVSSKGSDAFEVTAEDEQAPETSEPAAEPQAETAPETPKVRRRVRATA